MRIPVALAWALIVGSVFTAGLLRQFHQFTPSSPFAPPAVGSLLFASVVFLFLVSIRERRFGASPGPGMRLGSVTPLLLMLMVEKWISISFYNPAFYVLAPRDASPLALDAGFRAFAGAGLLAVCLLLAPFSRPAAVRTWRSASLPLALPGLGAALVAGVAAAAVLGALALAGGSGVHPGLPRLTPLVVWILVGQAALGFAEELYFRGLLFNEIERLSPRLGMRSEAARRWTAILLTSALFGMEHVGVGFRDDLRRALFPLCLGLLLGLLVAITRNLWLAAGVHAGINWLLLGVAPRWVDAGGRTVPDAAAYVAATLLAAFAAAALLRRPLAPRPPGSGQA